MQQIKKLPGANGVLVLNKRPLAFLPQVIMHGGPYRNRYMTDLDMMGFCLLEVPNSFTQQPGTFSMPIADFSVPADINRLNAALLRVYIEASEGRPVYVGCAGGIGRTGLFLSLVAKIHGIAFPILHVRAAYLGHAVETNQQEAFIDRYDIRPVRRAFMLYGIRKLMGLSVTIPI